MNLGHYGNGLTLTRVDYTGEGIRPITDRPPGSGHPTVHPCGKILADTYVGEPTAFGDGTVPIRWIDPVAKTEQTLVRIMSKVQGDLDIALRIDAHPAWDHSWRYVAFNGAIDNTRHVLLADLAGVI